MKIAQITERAEKRVAEYGGDARGLYLDRAGRIDWREGDEP